MCVAAFSAFALMSSANAQVVNQNEVVNVQMGYPGGPGAGPYNNISMSGYGYAAHGSMVANATPMAFNGSTWNIQAEAPYANGPYGTNTVISQSSATNLLYSTGGGSGIGYTISPNLLTWQQSVPTDTAMPLLSNLAGNYANGNPGTIVFSGLNNSAKYDITLEAYSGGFWGATFTLGMNSQSIAATHANDFTGWVLDGDYVEFNNISPTAGVISITEANGPGEADLSGFQIGEVVSAPEPSSTALLVLGAGALGFMMVRRAKSGRSLS